jgi:diguanylate cyclase (GGDEF)-like protein/PAS domain S-box-containing protein
MDTTRSGVDWDPWDQEEVWIEAALRTAGAVGERFFPALVEQVARLTGADHVLVAERLEAEQARVLAFWRGGALAEPFEYALAGTPCAAVLGGGPECFPTGVASRFPADSLLAELAADGYLGVPLIGAAGTAVGHLCVLTVTPLRDSGRLRATLSLFAARAAAELERVRAERARQESEERYALAMRGAHDGLWEWDLRRGSIRYSPRWKAMLGWAEDEVSDSPHEWCRRVHPEDHVRLLGKIHAHLEGKTPHLEDEHRMLHRDGSWRWVKTHGVATNHPGAAQFLAGSQTDVQGRRMFEERLRSERSLDPVTGLPSRRRFLAGVERGLAAPAGGMVVAFHLERFRTLNESLGHHAGDQLLRTLANRLGRATCGNDVLGRLSGGEFAVFFADHKSASERVAALLRLLSERTNIAGKTLFPRFSVGVAASGWVGNAEELLRRAEIAVHRAHSDGATRPVAYEEGMAKSLRDDFEIETALRLALESGEIVPHYQPVVGCEDRRLMGFEALARWDHPRLGLLAAAKFLPSAEDLGLVEAIGRTILRQACHAAASWSALPEEPWVSVNLSASEFLRAELCEELVAVLAESGLSASRLRLELTESQLLEDAESAAARLAQVRALGIGVMLDDFGVGYSSLAVLSRLPLDALKIDRVFLRQLPLMRAIVALARSLNLAVVAEGVESAADLATIRELGCDLGQGYWLGRPLAAPEPAL